VEEEVEVEAFARVHPIRADPQAGAGGYHQVRKTLLGAPRPLRADGSRAGARGRAMFCPQIFGGGRGLVLTPEAAAAAAPVAGARARERGSE